MKPHLTCHMVASADGRTLLSRWRPEGTFAAGLFERVFEELGGGTWLVGRVTGQEYAKAKAYPDATDERFPREAWIARRGAKAYGVVLDPHGKIAWGRADIEGDPIVVVLTERVPDAHLAGLRADSVSYVFAGEDEIDLSAALEALNRELGVERVVLQGGGATNGAFLRAGLIDALSLVVFPNLDGITASAGVFDGGEPGQAAPVEAMTLESCQVLDGGAVWLRYGIR
ncbi:MAG TPA: dihydrofolate reductase family protein [Methylobacterium sp.]|jgi:riboflavin biosynthesis pyrimidine reductase|nr:dihydrofolate reductase family protein [Methylobacterium sp.]